MSLTLRFSIGDTITPDIARRSLQLTPTQIAKLLLTPCKEYWAKHVAALPRHQLGSGKSAGPGPGGFWEGSSRSILKESRVEGSVVVLEGIGPPGAPGLRLRYLGTQAALGGPLIPKNKKWLVWGKTDESYGKTPYDYGWRPGGNNKAANLRMKGLFAFAKKVNQPPNPNVLPSDDDFAGVVLGVLERELKK